MWQLTNSSKWTDLREISRGFAAAKFLLNGFCRRIFCLCLEVFEISLVLRVVFRRVF